VYAGAGTFGFENKLAFYTQCPSKCFKVSKKLSIRFSSYVQLSGLKFCWN
jgi:hypothetical protein